MPARRFGFAVHSNFQSGFAFRVSRSPAEAGEAPNSDSVPDSYHNTLAHPVAGSPSQPERSMEKGLDRGNVTGQAHACERAIPVNEVRAGSSD